MSRLLLGHRTESTDGWPAWSPHVTRAGGACTAGPCWRSWRGWLRGPAAMISPACSGRKTGGPCWCPCRSEHVLCVGGGVGVEVCSANMCICLFLIRICVLCAMTGIQGIVGDGPAPARDVRIAAILDLTQNREPRGKVTPVFISKMLIECVCSCVAVRKSSRCWCSGSATG